jgi:phosphoglucosamine mutase
MGALFGTDGVRGEFGTDPITPENVLKLGWAVGSVLLKHQRGVNPQVLIGKDTRISGYILESALEAGFASAGMNVSLLGPMPTPGIAYLTRSARAAAGVVVSASHNPYSDNGIKFFSSDGFKLNEELINAVEEKMSEPIRCVPSDKLGKARRFPDAEGRYIEFCKHTLADRVSFEGMKVVVDCANGAAYNIAPSVFKELGADVISIGTSPDGFNINENCGSTSLDAVKAAVLEHRADIGIALDGDADRVLFIDEKGLEVNGDQVLYLMSLSKQAEGRLGGGVVGTLMTNLALELALEDANISFIRAAVGDRYVLEKLQENNWLLGGETSGHIIFLDKNTTGDGIVAALQVMRVMQKKQQSLNQLTASLSLFPQTMINVRVNRGSGHAIVRDTAVCSAVEQAEAKMGRAGRVVLRPSGTEPLVRVMVEGEQADLVRNITQELAGVVESASKQLVQESPTGSWP